MIDSLETRYPNTPAPIKKKLNNQRNNPQKPQPTKNNTQQTGYQFRRTFLLNKKCVTNSKLNPSDEMQWLSLSFLWEKTEVKCLQKLFLGQNIEMNLRADMKTHYKNFQRVWNMINTEWYRYLRVM